MVVRARGPPSARTTGKGQVLTDRFNERWWEQFTNPNWVVTLGRCVHNSDCYERRNGSRISAKPRNLRLHAANHGGQFLLAPDSFDGSLNRSVK